MATGTLSVRGRGVVWARPDRYRLSFVIKQVEASAEAALAEVARRKTVLENQLAADGVEPGAWSTGHLSLQEEREWDGRLERWLQRGHRATAIVELRHHDHTVAARLIQAAASLAEINGPSWYISQEHPARLDACAGAVRDARAKAEAYVSALGLGLGSLTQIREQGTGQQPHSPVFMGAMAMSAGGQDTPQLNLEPGDEEVSADVELAFDVEAG